MFAVRQRERERKNEGEKVKKRERKKMNEKDAWRVGKTNEVNIAWYLGIRKYNNKTLKAK